MTESRKIQLETVVDNSGAKQGFESLKADARDMAQAVGQAGQQASKGLGGIGDGAAPAAQKIDAATRSIISSIQRATVTMQAGAKGSADYYEALASTRGIDVSQLKAYTDELRKVEDAQRQAAQSVKADAFVANIRQQADAIGKTRTQLLEMEAAQLGLSDKVAPYIARLKEAEQGQQKLGSATKLTAFQTQQIGYQLHDFGVQILSGQSALTAFVQQGSQLSGTFGGAGNALRAVLSLVTPFRIGMVAAAAGVGVFALELVHAEEKLRSLNTLQAQLAATARSGLFSNNQLEDFIKQLSQAQGVTRQVATGIVSELAKAHDIGGALFSDLAKLANDYAKATGTTATAAAATLAKAFSDPAQGAKELDKALGTLTSTQILAIEKLVRQGDTLGAQRALYEALAQSIKGIADNGATPLQKSVNDLGNAWERAMDQMDHSEGLRTVNALLAKTIGAVQWLIENAPKLGGLGNIGISLLPGALPGALGTAAGSSIRSAIGGLFNGSSSEFQGHGASGSFEAPAAKAAGTVAGPSADDLIKRQLEVANGYQSEAGKIKDLTEKRRAMNKALAESNSLYGVNSEQSKRLREGIAGIGEEIRNLAKKGNADTQSVIDARLQGQIKAAQEALTRERDLLSFQQRYLAGQYQAGELSVVEFYNRKRQAIAAGIDAEVAELEKERAAVAAHLAKTVDPGKQQQDRERLLEIDRKEADLRTQAGRETILANQEQIASYKQLADQVANYRADLLQLQGDEAGAARVRAQQALLQAAMMAKQSAGSATPISQADLEAQRIALEQTLKLNAAKNATGIINQSLQLEEQRIADAQRRGAISSSQALDLTGEARRRAVAQLEEVVKAQEEVAKSRPKDYQLQIDTAAARQELERLKDELDPLAEKFRTLFTDATGNLFADLSNDPKHAKDAIKKWLNGIMSDINAQLGKDLATQLFGKEGPLGKLPGAIGDLFRRGSHSTQDKPLVDTSGVTQSLSDLQTSGLQPATAALSQFTQALQTAAGVVAPAGTTALPAPQTAGDFARFDRTNPVNQAAEEDAQQSARRLTATNEAAANATLDLAIAAGRGGSALSLLPHIISIIKAAASSDGGGSGGWGGIISKLIGSGGGGGEVNLGTAKGSDLALYYASGGYTGDVDPSKPAGIVHGKEFVFDAQSTAMIGRETLERMQRAARQDPAQAAAELISRVRGKREFGGPVEAGGLYEVNERRPELLTMDGRDFLMMGARRGEVRQSQGSGDIHIINNTMGRVDRAEQRTLPNGEKAIILQQAVEHVAAQLGNANSPVSKAMKQHFAVTRNR